MVFNSCEKGHHYCEWLLEEMDDDPRMIDEGWFHLMETLIILAFAFISFINGSITLCRYPGFFFNFIILFTQTVGLLGRVISQSQGCYLHTGQHKYRTNAQTDVNALSGIRNHDLSLRTSEDSSCLRPRDHCDRPVLAYGKGKVVPVLN
jgi:hypothetical protein